MTPQTLTLSEHTACRRTVLAALPTLLRSDITRTPVSPYHTGLLCVALVQLAAAENVTLCWGEMIELRCHPPACLLCTSQAQPYGLCCGKS